MNLLEDQQEKDNLYGELAQNIVLKRVQRLALTEYLGLYSIREH